MAGLRERDLQLLLADVTVKRAAGRLSVPVEYGGYSSDIFLRIHLLPYLIPIRSERQLAFAVAEKDSLRQCVGLTKEGAPQRGSLWHFRKRNGGAFRHLLARSLASIYIDAAHGSLALPFVKEAEEGSDGGIVEDFQDPKSGILVRLSYPLPARLASRERQLSLAFDGMRRSGVEVATRVYLPDDIGFPICATFRGLASRKGYQTSVFGEPAWLREPNRAMEIEDFGKGGRAPYTACNVVVSRLIEGEEHILLSKRRQGAGRGTYTLPGGKKGNEESLYACAARELKEETGLILESAKPVSVRRTQKEGYPEVLSVGILASARGEPKRREHHQHCEWEWFKVHELPKPLFFPTQMVLEDLAAGTFSNLSWEELEAQNELPLWRNL